MSRPELEQRLSQLSRDVWAPEAPPALDTERVFATPQLQPHPAGDAGAPAPGHWWREVLFRPAFALAVSALVIVLAAGAFTVLGGNDDPVTPVGPPRTEFALTPFEAPGKSWQASIAMPAKAGEEAELKVGDLPPLPADHHYEAWLISEAGEVVSLKSFKLGPDGTADVVFPVNVDPSQFTFVDISLEPDDGDSAHSGESLLRSAAMA